MEYDIYYHDDFDGMVSAAVMLDFLEKRGDKIKKFIPIKYDIRPRWPKVRFARPTVIVDFYYHPAAAFWFDHHPTSFIKSEWKKKFRPDKFHHLGIKYSSCCHLVLNKLVKYFDYEPPRRLKELSHWADIIDGANFRSARQTIEIREPAMQLFEFAEWHKIKNFDSKLIRLLSEKTIPEIVALPRVRKEIVLIKKEKRSLLQIYKKNLKIYDKLTFINLTAAKGELRFAPFYLYPKVIYSLVLKKYDSGVYHITFGANPWQRKKKGINIGAFLRKHYKGGGHREVGGAEFRSVKAANKAVQEIISLLGNKQDNK